MKAAAILVVTMIALGFALNMASCSAQNACATSGATAGAAGSSCAAAASAGSAGTAATTCDALTGLQACLSGFCAGDGAGVGSPFCGCYASGLDLSGSTDTSDPSAPPCTCITFHADAFCAQATANGLTAANYADCAAVTSPLISMCVGVQ
jgi:hypothetical protein